MGLFDQSEYVRLSPDGQDFLIQLQHPVKLEQLKVVLPGLKHDQDTGEWIAASSFDNSRYLRDLKLSFTQAATKHSILIKRLEQDRIAASGALDAELDLEGFGKQPYPFQRAGIVYALDRKRVIIGDDMGLGKTIQGLGVLYKTGAYPALIVTPSSNKYKWAEDEVPNCIPGKVVCLATKKTPLMELMAADIIVTNYHQLVGQRSYKSDGKTVRTAWIDQTKKIPVPSELAVNLMKVGLKTIILDEAQYIANPNATWTLVLNDMRHGVDWRMLLTGTPMVNYAADLYSPLKFLDRIHEFGGFMGFMSKYCGMKRGKFGIEAKEAYQPLDLNQKLRASCYVRRRKCDVLKDLPAKIRTTYGIDIDNRAEYDRAEKELVQWVQERVDRDKKFLQSIQHLSESDRAAAIAERKDYKAAAAERGEVIVKINALKTVAAEGKLTAAKEWIDDFLKSGEKLVIFAAHVKILDWLQHHYPHSAVIRSEKTAQEREQAVRNFQQHEMVKTLIGAMGTSAGNSPAGIGHTLTAASNVLTLEYGWNPAHHDQMEDRCHRIGQLDSVTCHYLLARNTIEEEVIAPLIEHKRGIALRVVDGIDEDEGGGILEAVYDWVSKKSRTI